MDIRSTVLITGASAGIGKELAYVFAKNNYNVVLVARTQSSLEALAQQLRSQYNIQATVIAKDLIQANAAEQIFKEIQALNIPIDVLVNNAGFGTQGAFVATNMQEQLNEIQVNITALTALTHLFLGPMLKNNKGKILNVASTAAFQAGPQMAVYCATKAYVLSFSEAIAYELKNSGITVTALCPGVTKTEFQQRAKMTDVRMMKNNFLMMTANEVANIGFQAMIKGKAVAIAGVTNKALAFLTRLTPRCFGTAIAGYLMGK